MDHGMCFFELRWNNSKYVCIHGMVFTKALFVIQTLSHQFQCKYCLGFKLKLLIPFSNFFAHVLQISSSFISKPSWWWPNVSIQDVFFSLRTFFRIFCVMYQVLWNYALQKCPNLFLEALEQKQVEKVFLVNIFFTAGNLIYFVCEQFEGMIQFVTLQRSLYLHLNDWVNFHNNSERFQ